MCGIFGHYCPTGPSLELVERMALALTHRGPDGYSVRVAGGLAFGAGRLAIIDLDAPAGPLFNEDGKIAVIFNGEIYNYKALRKELEGHGHVFATRTDTEVIVHGYEQWGVDVLDHLRGMFALGIWDVERERLLLARDRMGEKPLYYTEFENGEILFASEIKALFEHSRLRRAVHTEMLPHYLVLGYVPPPHTMFAGIRKLAAGERLILDRGVLRVERYWTPVLDATGAPPYNESVVELRAALFDAVEAQMVSDVPIGAFLSGGMDSTAVVAIMQRVSGAPVRTFTVGFEAEPNSKADIKFNVDARYAALVSAELGTQHHLIRIRQDETLSALLPHLIYALDEPISIPTIVQTAYVAALARMHNVPVMLTGEAGDELFLGYNHYRLDRVIDRYLRLPALLRNHVLNPLFMRLPSPQFDRFRKLARKAQAADPPTRYLEWLRLVEPQRLPELLADPTPGKNGLAAIHATLMPYLEAPHTRHFADRVAYTGLRLPLPENGNMRVDKMCMAMSIEARSPLQDYRLVEFALRLPLHYKLRNGDSKKIFKDAASDLIPEAVRNRPKWGFTPPASEWLRTALRPLVERVLSPQRVEAAGFFQPEAVQRIVKAHIEAGEYELQTVWSLLVFHLWHALYIDRSLTLDHKLTPADLYHPNAARVEIPIRS